MLATVIGALVTAVLGYYFGIKTMQKQYRGTIGQEVWKARKHAYCLLLPKMEVLPLWPSRQGEATYGDLLNLSKDFRSWYFNHGGLFLAAASKNRYFAVQKKIEEVLEHKKHEEPLIEKDYNQVRKMLSALRTEMTNDLLSRERDLLSKKNEATTGDKSKTEI